MYKRTKIEAEVHPRFLCLEEFMNYTGLGRGSAMKLGKEIGCVMKVGKRALYDTRKALEDLLIQIAQAYIPNDDLIVRIPENEAEGELWSYEM